ncbi:replication protein A 70 kDa DNA-binding subunit [Striga asiatica]|uniref:Replication protein A 70 kDa DNA-binding subunit n=1 Tax=Striga asiatica TaxID=4170 RepID=A0A5A7NUG2_STRAF|nr:replication protein A 70 kDa DNA-binding subunit [Striga asiatica]
MSRVYLPIHQITDETNNWTALIQVVERPPVQTSKNNTSTLYRRYLFTDEEGTKVSVVVYNAVINEFDELLMPYKRYYLSGAKVRPEVPFYQVSDYKYNWLIVSGTNVEEYQESLPPQLPCHMDIHTFADIHKYADTDNPRSESKLVGLAEKSNSFTTTGLCGQPHVTFVILIQKLFKYIRCRLPITIEDQTGTMNAVIYGEDAERLITYSGNQLYEADQQGRDLTKEIAASVARHKVVCFVKQSKSAYHTVVKLYSIQMMMIQGNASTTESSGKESSTAAPFKATDPNLFSPTLKNVLESVALKIEKSPNVPTPESSTKKRINFDAQQDTTQTSSSTPTRSTLQPTQNTATSPSKKSRPKWIKSFAPDFCTFA